MRKLWVIGSAAFLALCGCGGAADHNAFDAPAEAPVVANDGSTPTNFGRVRDGLYRGGRPGEEGLGYLRDLGVRRVLDLESANFVEARPADLLDEETLARDEGLEWIDEPMSAFTLGVAAAFDERIDRILALLRTATPGDPIYVHCKHGEDRTGLVIGLERVFVEGWTPEAAYDEMLALGFHPALLGLDAYYKRKTGLKR